jgi:hypothetical protein
MVDVRTWDGLCRDSNECNLIKQAAQSFELKLKLVICDEHRGGRPWPHVALDLQPPPRRPIWVDVPHGAPHTCLSNTCVVPTLLRIAQAGEQCVLEGGAEGVAHLGAPATQVEEVRRGARGICGVGGDKVTHEDGAEACGGVAATDATGVHDTIAATVFRVERTRAASACRAGWLVVRMPGCPQGHSKRVLAAMRTTQS